MEMHEYSKQAHEAHAEGSISLILVASTVQLTTSGRNWWNADTEFPRNDFTTCLAIESCWPGPEAQQLATYIVRPVHRTPGTFVADGENDLREVKSRLECSKDFRLHRLDTLRAADDDEPLRLPLRQFEKTAPHPLVNLQ